jgi:uncharacterized membrane protein YeaQ/YmgE (transglycosylase-associated protein family)
VRANVAASSQQLLARAGWESIGGAAGDGGAGRRRASIRLKIAGDGGGTSMGFIWTLIIGLVAGAIAKFMMPGPDPGGIIITMLLGVAGAFLATWLGQTIGWYHAGEGAGLIGAVVGAVIILVAYRMLKRRSAT